MRTYRFTVIVEGPDLQDERCLEALYEAGCDDAMVGRHGPTQYLDFDRRAESFARATLSAIRDVETAGVGARVVRIAPDDLVTMSEIAERTGRTRESVRLLINAERGPGGFPAPATHFRSRQRMWRWQEVAVWFAEARGEPQGADDPGEARFVTAVNVALAWRGVRGDLSDAERRALEGLAEWTSRQVRAG